MRKRLIILTGLLCFLLVFPDGVPEEKIEDIINKCALAMSRGKSIRDVKSLRVWAVFPDHGDDPKVVEIKRPNLYNLGQGTVIFDGKQCCLPKGMDGKSEPQIMGPGDSKDCEVEIGFHFPAFLEYPAKFVGTEKLDGRKYFKILVVLPLGAKLFYYLDEDTYLPGKVTGEFTWEGKKVTPLRDFFDYRETGGLYLPFGFTYGSRTGRLKGWVTSYELNVSFKKDYFTFPKSEKK